MSRTFLDTAGLIGLWDTSDQWHELARQAFGLLSRRRSRIVTTSYILLECGNSAARTRFRPAVDRLRQTLAADGGLIHPTDEDWSAAWSAYRQGSPGDAGIVDHVSFTVMRRLGISDVFTNDKHFKIAGFNTLI